MSEMLLPENVRCGLPLILIMAVDSAIRDGKMTIEEAIELLTGKRKEDTQ